MGAKHSAHDILFYSVKVTSTNHENSLYAVSWIFLFLPQS